MGKDWKYIMYVLLAAGLYLAVQLSAPRKLNWTVTYHRTDTNPFGGYVLHQLVSDIFPEINENNFTCYELLDTLKDRGNFVSISNVFNPGREDVVSLLNYVDNGGSALIAAQNFYGLFADTLNLEAEDYLFENLEGYFSEGDTVSIVMNLNNKPEYYYRRANVYNYLSSYDSANALILATNDVEYPVLISMKWGKGKIYVSTTPMAFTNIAMLSGENHRFAEMAFSNLPDRELHWTEFYHLGRMEVQTPLRYVLGVESLRWAYYIAIAGLLLFILFEMKRKQRMIPVIETLKNTTMEFTGTVGNLYYQSKDHKNIAEKRISFLSEQLRAKHGVNLKSATGDSIKNLARKTGNSEEDVRALFDAIRFIQQSGTISELQLLDFNKRIENFNY